MDIKVLIILALWYATVDGGFQAPDIPCTPAGSGIFGSLAITLNDLNTMGSEKRHVNQKPCPFTGKKVTHVRVGIAWPTQSPGPLPLAIPFELLPSGCSIHMAWCDHHRRCLGVRSCLESYRTGTFLARYQRGRPTPGGFWDNQYYDALVDQYGAAGFLCETNGKYCRMYIRLRYPSRCSCKFPVSVGNKICIRG